MNSLEHLVLALSTYMLDKDMLYFPKDAFNQEKFINYIHKCACLARLVVNMFGFGITNIINYL